MQTRFSTALGFLAAASLLGGSAFAFAPTFTGDLPTVIITDKISGAVTNIYDPGNATTQYLFRYQDAFDLSSPAYVNAGASATINDVRFLFNEFRDINKDGVPDSASPEIGVANHTILIQDATGGDNVAFATVGTPFPLSSTDFTSAPKVGLLDFRNIDFSPAADYESVAGIPFDAVGSSVPVHTIGTDPATGGAALVMSGAQFRVVQIYIDTAFSTQAPNLKSFTVITSLDGNDRLTTGVPGLTGPPITNIVPTSTDFSGWDLSGNALLALLPQTSNSPTFGGTAYGQLPAGGNAGNFTGFSTVPSLNFPTDNPGTADPFDNNIGASHTTLAGTTSLTMNSANNAVGFVRFAKSFTANVAANQLIRFRVRLESATNTASSKDDFKFGMGGLRTGVTNTFYSANTCRAFDSLYTTPLVVGPETKYYNPPASPGADFDNYLIPEAPDSTNTFAVYLDLQSVDDATAATGNDIKMTQWTLSSIDMGANRANLTNKTVLLNRGNPTLPALAAGEVLTPAPGAVPYTFGTPANTSQLAGQTNGVGAQGNTSINGALTMGGTANALTYDLVGASVPSGATTFYPDFRGFSFYEDIPWLDIDHPTGGHFRVTNGKLYFFDIWLSTTTPSSTDIPQLRINTNFGSLDTELTSFFIQDFTLAGPPPLTLNPGVAVQASPRAYTAVNRAELGPTATAPGFVNVEFLQPSLSTMSTNANVTVHRITVTETDTP